MTPNPDRLATRRAEENAAREHLDKLVGHE